MYNFCKLMLPPKSIPTHLRSPVLTYLMVFFSVAHMEKCCLAIRPDLCVLWLARQKTADGTSARGGKSCFTLEHFSAFCLVSLFCPYTCFHPHLHSSPLCCLFCFPLSSPLHDSIIFYSLCSHSRSLKDLAEFTNGHDSSPIN